MIVILKFIMKIFINYFLWIAFILYYLILFWSRLALFQDLEKVLRCGICYDYMTTSMMVMKCSHNCKFRGILQSFVFIL